MTFEEFELADNKQHKKEAKGCFDEANAKGPSWGGSTAPPAAGTVLHAGA